MSAALQQAAVSKISECYALAEKKYGIKMPQVNVAFDLESVRLAGTANLRSGLIRLNPVMMKKYTDEFINSTAVHEAAHIITTQLWVQNKIRKMPEPHGKEWKNVMTSLGVSPDRCHNYDVRAELSGKRRNLEYNVFVCNKCNHVYNTSAKIAASIHRRQCRCGCSELIFRGKSLTKFASVEEVDAALGVNGSSGTPVQAVKKTVNKPVVKPKTKAVSSKKENCVEIYLKCRNTKTRAQIINMFIEWCDMTSAGAATYYANIKKQYG